MKIIDIQGICNPCTVKQISEVFSNMGARRDGLIYFRAMLVCGKADRARYASGKAAIVAHRFRVSIQSRDRLGRYKTFQM